MTSLSAVFNVQREAWMSRGKCVGQDPAIFILDQGFTAAKAITFCRVCPVAEECADYATRTGSTGVWGGKLFTQRTTEPVEYLVVQDVQDSRPRAAIAPDAVASPSIFGVPRIGQGILGTGPF